MRTPHTSVKKGKRVFIILRDGTKLVDKFLDHKSGHVILEKHGRIAIDQIRALSINKLKDEQLN
jgi:hypothetical protein